MKRIFYIFLMMIFFIMITVTLYYCTIYGLVMNHVVPLRYVIIFTDIALSWEVFGFLSLVGTLLGYFFGKKWWKIIYVDKVYYFDKSAVPT